MPRTRRVRVTHANPFDPQRYEFPWRVSCDWCAGDYTFLGPFATIAGYGTGVKGGTASWSYAMAYALDHAERHRATQCPTCLHIPAETIA